MDNEQVVSSVAGTIERVNKLVTVRAIRTRYNPEVGDLVVGRISEASYLSVTSPVKLNIFFTSGATTTMEGRCKLATRRRSYAILC